MQMQSMQQKRAGFALKNVRFAANDGNVRHDEYKSYAAALPAMIQMNGLGQAAAFYKSKGGTHRKLYDLLSEWLTDRGQPYAGKADLMEGITENGISEYRLAQAEAQALMDWVKKFAKAYMSENKQ